MELFYVGILIIIVYIVLNKVVIKKDTGDTKVNSIEKLPYKITDNFLTDTERSFYHTLNLYIGDKAIICPKVGLKDIFFIGKGAGKDYMKYFNRIAKKHVDFLLCEKNNMKPICGIELDDISHTNKKSYERDLFISEVYKDAGFELIRLSSKSGYTISEIEAALSGVLNRSKEIPVIQEHSKIVVCPKCNIPMVLRKATKGKNAGKVFYGCSNYPNCKEVINTD